MAADFPQLFPPMLPKEALNTLKASWLEFVRASSPILRSLATHPLQSQSLRSGGWFSCLDEKEGSQFYWLPTFDTFDSQSLYTNEGLESQALVSVEIFTRL